MPLQVSQTTNNPMRPYSGDDLLRDPFLKKGIDRAVLLWLRAWRDWWRILTAHLLLAHLQTGKGWDERKQYASKEWMLLPSSYGYGTCTFFPECTSWDLPASSPWDVTGAEQSQSSPSANRNHCMQGIRHSLLPHYVCNAMSMLLLIIQKLKMMLTVRNRKTKHVKEIPPLTLLSHTHVNQSFAETALWEVDQTEFIWRPIGVSPRHPGVFYTQDIF